MQDSSYYVAFLFVAGVGTALACGLGAVPVFLLGERLDAWQAALRGVAAGLMTVASIEGLIRPALHAGGLAQTGLGLIVGVVFVAVLRRLLQGRDVKVSGMRGSGVRHSVLVFLVLFIHSLPEGMAMGAAQASGVEGLNAFILAAIALQNVPEGTAVAIPMVGAGFGKRAQFLAAILSSAPQPIGAPLAYLLVEQVTPLLAVSLAFAGGAMLAVVVLDLVPEAFTRTTWRKGVIGALVGGAVMLAASAFLGV